VITVFSFEGPLKAEPRSRHCYASASRSGGLLVLRGFGGGDEEHLIVEREGSCGWTVWSISSRVSADEPFDLLCCLDATIAGLDGALSAPRRPTEAQARRQRRMVGRAILVWREKDARFRQGKKIASKQLLEPGRGAQRPHRGRQIASQKGSLDGVDHRKAAKESTGFQTPSRGDATLSPHSATSACIGAPVPPHRAKEKTGRVQCRRHAIRHQWTRRETKQRTPESRKLESIIVCGQRVSPDAASAGEARMLRPPTKEGRQSIAEAEARTLETRRKSAELCETVAMRF